MPLDRAEQARRAGIGRGCDGGLGHELDGFDVGRRGADADEHRRPRIERLGGVFHGADDQIGSCRAAPRAMTR